jgi:hypothetical protein
MDVLGFEERGEGWGEGPLLLKFPFLTAVIPANAGIHLALYALREKPKWIPAVAGMSPPRGIRIRIR